MSDTTDAIARFHALLSTEGKKILDRLLQEELTEQNELKIGQQLRKDFPVQLVIDAITQHQLRLKARAKFPQAMEMFFTKQGLEQASSDAIAEHRAKRFCDLKHAADFCCGIGGDLSQLAKVTFITAVDILPLHLEIAKANAQVLGVDRNLTFIQSDVRDVPLANLDAIFIDPARRTAASRLKTGLSEPPLEWCINLSQEVANLCIKAAPGIDHALFPEDWELEFIALGKDLKEAVAWSPALARGKRRATILPDGHTMIDEKGSPVEIKMPGEFLVDPNPAITRAGLVEELARQLAAWKIDDKIGFLSLDSGIKTPFGRTLRIIDSGPWNDKQLAKRLKSHDIGIVDIRRRGLAGDIDQFQKRLKLTGSRKATLAMTRVKEKPWALICVDID